MKIAQVAPLMESVPPVRYGGTERVVSYLTEELVELGHDVTLFASSDSISNAHLMPGCKKALRHDACVTDQITPHMIMLENIIDYAPDFDIIHFHTGDLHYGLTRHISIPHITTHHGRLDLPELDILYNEHNDIPVVSVSNQQRTPFPDSNWQATVYNGIPEQLYDFSTRHNGYLAFLGRISPEKGILEAIDIAQRVGMELKIAAKVDKVDEEYFNLIIKPLLKSPGIEFLGEINNTEKNNLLGNAYAMLFPVQWAEPDSMVIMEAMACGTPVIAFRRGSVVEVLQDGLSGFIVNDVAEAVSVVDRIETLNRKKCHAEFSRRYTARRMANDYLSVYEKYIAGKSRRPARVVGRSDDAILATC